VRCSIWLTDDPWNKALSSKWIFQAIPEYTVVFTPRKANMAELSTMAPGRVSYLPFGYDPRYFHPLPEAGPPLHDLFFAGGADQDRASYIAPMINAGIQVGLYGTYWERFAETRSSGKGYAAPGDLSTLIARSRVCLCLVRQANRDGHCMRTFELAAAGACIIAEDTAEHRAVYGPEGETVVYAANSTHAASLCRELLDSPNHRQRMSQNALRLASEGGHAYAHRLSTILDTCYSSADSR
jgi:spore maturation protein CgeB